MSYIYHSSILTIAGSASSGPFEGIFRRADAAHLDTSLADTLPHTKLDKVRHRKALVHEAAEMPLLKRCWVHQERLLSPRFLHFGRHELMWECMENLACECGGARYDHRLDVPKWLASKARFDPRMMQHVDWELGSGPSAWHDVVSDYSGMKLTKAKDIFPAISGLARSVSDATGWEYVAGLWKENMIVDLLWTTDNPQLASRCERWRAPTFSWASITSRENIPRGNRVSYRTVNRLRQGLDRQEGRVTIPYATLVAWECVPEERNQLGELKSASLVLQGTLIRATLCSARSTRLWSIVAYGKGVNDRDVLHIDFDFAKDPEQGANAGDEVFCLKLIGSKKSMKYADEEYLVWLVLKEVPAECTDQHDCRTFMRIGLLVGRNDDVHLDDESEKDAVEYGVHVRIV